MEGSKDQKGGQVDLLLVRKDNIVDCCEVKFLGAPFTLEKGYKEQLSIREGLLAKKLPRSKVIHHVLISPYGITKNQYNSFFLRVITLEDFFR